MADDLSNFFVPLVSGIIHVGANVGQERELYARHHLKVLWVEPIPAFFRQLCVNIAGYPGQTAVNCLITDKDDEEYIFNVASNNGESSSILEWAQHRDHRPDIDWVSHIPLRSKTLDTLIECIDEPISAYSALTIDTQGSELLVMKGAIKNLSKFTYIRTEATNFEAYVGCCRDKELTAYLDAFGFNLVMTDEIGDFGGGRKYYDLVYRNREK